LGFTQKGAQDRFADKRFTLDWIKRFSERDGEALILHTEELEMCLNQDEIPFSVIEPMVTLLVSKSLIESERSDKIYQVVLESKFFRYFVDIVRG
jgi:hypothetical protein